MKRKKPIAKKPSAFEREFEIRKKHKSNSPEALNVRIDVHLELIRELEARMNNAPPKEQEVIKNSIASQKMQIRLIRKYLERKK